VIELTLTLVLQKSNFMWTFFTSD